MASIKDLYDKSDFSKYPQGAGKDKTPINPDGGLDLATDEKALKKARLNYELGANPDGGKGYNPSKMYKDSNLS